MAHSEKTLVTHYKLPKHSFLAGLVFFFGGDNPFHKAIQTINRTNAHEALLGDLERIRRDFISAIEGHQSEFSR